MRIIPVLIAMAVLAVFFVSGVPQIDNGGFEAATVGPPPQIPDWTVSGAQDASVLNAADAGMPTEGSGWLQLGGAGSVDGQKPTVIGGFGAPPTNVVSIAQTFKISGTDTRLELDAVFLSNESPGTIWDDFLSIDVTDGNQSYNLLVLDIDDAMPAQSTLYNRTLGGPMPATAVRHVSLDLPAVFPGATDQTDFTLTLSVGNAIDASLPSRAYFDGIRLTTGSPVQTAIPPASVRVLPLPGGDWRFVAEAPGWPGGEFYTVFSGSVLLPVGMGPFGGIVPDGSTYFSITQPLGVPPFHMVLDQQGRYEFQIPAWAAPNVTADCFIAVFYAGILVEVSPPIRHTY